MYGQMGVPVSFAGVLSMLIAAGTILSSLMSDRLTRKFGAGKVTLVSVAMTAAALLGFSLSSSFWMLCLWAIPLRPRRRQRDAALNNDVAASVCEPPHELSALHVGRRHHGRALRNELCAHRRTGLEYGLPHYRVYADGAHGYTAFPASRFGSAAAMFLPSRRRPLPKQRFRCGRFSAFPVPKRGDAGLFGYCSLEQTRHAFWASSYMVLHNRITPKRLPDMRACFLSALRPAVPSTAF